MHYSTYTPERSGFFHLPTDLNLAFVSEQAVAVRGNPRILLGEPMDLLPSFGLEFDHSAMAHLIDSVGLWLAERGVKAGHRVVVLKRNNFDIVVLACAIARLGAVPALLSSGNDPEVLPTLLDRLQPSTVITDGDCFVGHRLSMDGEHRVINLDDDLPQLVDAGSSWAVVAPREPDEASLITQTSGTTGVPKLVAHSGRSILGHARMQVPLGRAVLRRGDLLAGCLPWVHARSIAAYVAAAYMGNPILAIGNPERGHVHELLVKHRPRYLEAHPDALLQWEELADIPNGPFASVRLFFSTFDAVHPRTIRALLRGSESRLPIYAQVYAQSETSGVTVRFYTRRSARRLRDGRGVGRGIWPYTKIRVYNVEADRVCRSGEVGMIQARSVGRCITYVGEEDVAAAKRHGEWWDMTDLGYRTRSGNLYLLDREADAIPGVGSGIEIEDHLLELLPGCDEAILLADDAGELVTILSLREGATYDADAWARCAEQLGLDGQPLIVDRARIPRTATGKVRRARLRSELELLR